jgi:dTDP-4-dehydrorhamnose reductase
MLEEVVAGIGNPGRELREHGETGVNDSGYSGILHFANAGECSWQEYAQHALDYCHKLGLPLKARTVAPLKLCDMKNFIARRPVYSVLSTVKYTAQAGASPRSWRDVVADYVNLSYSKK